MENGTFTEWKFSPGDSMNQSFIDKVMASASLPLLFPMRCFNDDCYVDGGVLRNLIALGPIAQALTMNATEIDVVMISLTKSVPKIPIEKIKSSTLIGIMARTLQILYSNIGDVYIECPSDVDIKATIYNAPIFECDLIDFSCCKDMFYDGLKNGLDPERTDVITLC